MNGQVARPASRQASDVLAALASFRPQRHPKATTFGLLWLLGLYALFVAPAPVKITEEKLQAYTAKLTEAEGMIKSLASSERRLMDAELYMQEVQVWFWRWRPEHRAEVERRRPAVDAARQRVATLRQERDGILRQAKGELGLWSEAGLEESRALLWNSFASGKVFAQRQTIWDGIFSEWVALCHSMAVHVI